MNLTIERYVWAVSRGLRRWVPAERRREIRRELRAHLAAAADDVGAAEAVARAGAPATVAREYAEVEADRPRRWRPRAGAVAAPIAFLLIAILQQRELHLQRAAHWAEFDPWSADLWLVRLHGDLEEGLLVHVYIQRLAYILVPLVAFLLFSRVWRRGRPRWKREAAAL
jgi:HAAS